MMVERSASSDDEEGGSPPEDNDLVLPVNSLPRSENNGLDLSTDSKWNNHNSCLSIYGSDRIFVQMV